jgi:hypothetical protein
MERVLFMKIFVTALFFISTQILAGQKIPVQLGQTKIYIAIDDFGRGHTYVHVHQNEKTALLAAKHVARKRGGRVISLIHSGGRNIIFYMKRQRYEFDPNRIFSETGIQKTLREFGPYNTAAHLEVKKLRKQLLALLPRGKIIAVHNNQSYSIKNYFPGQDNAKDASSISLYPQNFYRNFYVVTQKRDFERLKQQKLNSVLQSKTPSDDGSLSVFLSKRQYLNVEAAHGALAAQIDMLERA